MRRLAAILLTLVLASSVSAAKLQLPKASTSVELAVFIQDSSSTTGAGLTGLVFDSSGLGCHYWLESAAADVDITLVTATLGTFTDSGFIVIDGTNMPGMYSLHPPDAALTGADNVVIFCDGATNMAPLILEIQLTGVDLNDAVRGGMTALPAANADAAGGLTISDLGGLDLDAQNTNVNDIETAADAIKLETDKLTLGDAGAGVAGSIIEEIEDIIPRGDSAWITATGFSDFDETTDPVELLDSGGTAGTSAEELTDDNWDEVLTGATHNVTNSSGKRLRQIEAAFVLHSGTAQAGASNTVTLDTGANAADDFYNHTRIVITANTGVEQERIIVDYDGTTKVATIAPPWITQPDVTSEFEVEPAMAHAETGWATIKVGVAAAATATTITLDANAEAIDDFYNGDLVHIDHGTGEGQSRVITAYAGATTKIATVHATWTTTPDTTSEYVVEEAHPYLFGYGPAGAGLDDLGGMSTGMKAEVNIEADTALTDYDPPTDAEMIARTLLAAAYFDPAADTVATVTTVTTTTTNTDMRGTDSALLAASAPTNFGDLDIEVTTGRVDLYQIEGTAAKAAINTEADTAATDYGALKPTTAGRTLDINATGEVALDLDATTGTWDLAEFGTDAFDNLLKRDMSAVTGESARSPLNCFRFLRNRRTITGSTTLTVYEEDDSTTAWTATIVEDAAANPVTSITP